MRRMRVIAAAGMLVAAACAGPSSPAAPSAGAGEAPTAAVPAIAPRSITGAEAQALLASDTRAVLLDVRTPAEYTAGHAAGARLLPHDAVRARASSELPDRNAAIVLYCRSGRRSGLAAADLAELGYTRVYDLGPLSAWPGEVRDGGS